MCRSSTSLTPSIWPKTATAQARARQAAPEAAEKRHCLFGRAGAAGGRDLGLPLVVRPSYVLGGRAMADHPARKPSSARLSARHLAELVPGDVKARYPNDKPARSIPCWAPIRCCRRYLSDAIEIDVDCLMRRQGHLHRRHHGAHRGSRIHSGDSACSLPPHSLDAQMNSELERQTRELALGLDVVGLMNVQYAIKDGDIYVLEVNPRGRARCRSSPR